MLKKYGQLFLINMNQVPDNINILLLFNRRVVMLLYVLLCIQRQVLS